MTAAPATPRLISVDWGTTSFRAYLVADGGAILARVERPDGILAVRDGDFAGTLARAISPWLDSATRLLVLLSGMIGSRQGWVEAPYLACPADAAALARAMITLSVADLPPIRLVPGLLTHNAGGLPDVMRGEETQILGAAEALGRTDGLFVLPGTHAKWVTVANSRIAGFETYMTGEVFAALKGHTILGRLMSEPSPATIAPDARASTNTDSAPSSGFARGVAAGARGGHPGALLNRIFSTRTLGLTGGLADDMAADYLSGLLIGSELGAATAIGADPGAGTGSGGDTHDNVAASGFVVIAAPGLGERYLTAAGLLGLRGTLAPPDCVVAGHLALLRHAS